MSEPKDDLPTRLRKTAVILRTQADLAARVAETYAPQRAEWEQAKGDDRLNVMIRYQLDQEQLARSLTKDADEAEEAADRIEAQANLIEGLRGYVMHTRICSAIDMINCTCGLTTLLASIKEPPSAD